MIGSYSWSYSVSGQSTARSGDMYCSSCTVDVTDVAITDSVSVSNTTGELWAALHALCCLRCVSDCACVLRWLLQ
jgi:hypothetical protein